MVYYATGGVAMKCKIREEKCTQNSVKERDKREDWLGTKHENINTGKWLKR